MPLPYLGGLNKVNHFGEGFRWCSFGFFLVLLPSTKELVGLNIVALIVEYTLRWLLALKLVNKMLAAICYG